MSGGGLDELCEYLGIGLEYHDAWGNRTTVPPETKRALLSALGCDVADAAAVSECLARLRAEDGQCVLPSLVVCQVGNDALSMEIMLPRHLAAKVLPWRIVLEDGDERTGVVLPRPVRRGRPGGRSGGDDGQGRERRAPVDPDSGLRSALDLCAAVPPGIHRLLLYEPGQPQRSFAETRIAVCPRRCFELYRIDGCDSARVWGPAVQLYALRSPYDWGIGDFGDLLRLVNAAADAGAHFVGVNPLHALFPHDPARASPYSPSNREWLNVLYLEIETMRDFGESASARQRVESDEFRQRLQALRAAPLIDYVGVAAAKLEILELLYRHFRLYHLERNTQRAGLFRDFQREGGRSLRAHALFDALQEHFHARDASIWGWTVWPEAYRDIDGQAVESFALANEERIEFFEYLQWQAEVQLRRVTTRAHVRGMAIGLYRDLAVGVNEGGSETWARTSRHALTIHAGAPPDELNPAGQDWGFPPAIPRRLAEEGYASFLAVLRANMRHAGALRIDHVMSLMRLFWLPTEGETPVGAYVAYPMEDLFGLVCLESMRHQCLVIGEDLGIVPQEVRDAMAEHGLLSYRPLYFEQHWDEVRFKPPREWPALALATVGTHDLPTLRGYWAGHDLRLRDERGMYRDPALRDRQFARRERERRSLLEVLAEEGLLSEEGLRASGSGTDPAGVGDADPRLAVAVHRYVARSPSLMTAVQLEDVLGQLESVNLPGTNESEYPNWRRKLAAELGDIEVDPAWRAIAGAMNGERPCPLLHVSGGPAHFHPETADVPRATYRLQFHREFGFADAEDILPYLAELGISHVYAAPFLKARPGSRHGYDIVDHQAVNPEIGTEEEFDRYGARLRELGLGQVLDIVPNHVGVLGADNAWWRDVLENGMASEHAEHFDIDWDPPLPELTGKVLLPVLGDQYGVVLESGELKLVFCPDRGEFEVRYYEHRFPVDPCNYPAILADPLVPSSDEGEAPQDQLELETLIAALRHLPSRGATEPMQIAERRRNKELFKQQLASLYQRFDSVRARVDTRVRGCNGRAGEPASFDELHALLSQQAYRLASWRVAADDINYRRFFDVNDLAALRMESEEVFEATHAQIFGWIGEGRVTGLRIDHPDGLSDPAAYFERLQTRYAEVLRENGADEATASLPALYVIVEKILGEFEMLPPDWPVHGDTGYRFANLCNGLFVDPAQESRFSRIYRSFAGESLDFSDILRQSKLLIMAHSLPGELSGLTHMLHRIAQSNRRTRDFTRSRLRAALMEVIAGFPVYRSYIGPDGRSATDRRYLDRAVELAETRTRAGDPSVLRFLRDVLVSAPTERDEELRELKLRFARRFQQFTAPVMAKAMEDTAFYRYNRLVSLNDVGGDPHTFGIPVEDFHAANERITASHPYGLLASSTHDSKRSEDVRARIDVLSEIPGPWRLALRRWRRTNQRLKSRVDDELAPSANDEYLLYQTLVGVWPMTPPDSAQLADLIQRVDAYMLKAVREAKQHTSWLNPEPAYEAALSRFVRRLFSGGLDNPFLSDLVPFQAAIAPFGAWNSLNMLLLKLTAPGVPDVYQGCELWNLALVDPDNRRAVDFPARREALRALQRDFPPELAPERLRIPLEAMVSDLVDGRLKLYLLWRGLAVRQIFGDTMRDGRYLALKADGPAAQHVVAFARVDSRGTVVAVASRLLLTQTGGDGSRLCEADLWSGTTIELPRAYEGSPWRDALSQATHRTERNGKRCYLDVARLFSVLPFALLTPPLEHREETSAG